MASTARTHPKHDDISPHSSECTRQPCLFKWHIWDATHILIPNSSLNYTSTFQCVSLYHSFSQMLPQQTQCSWLTVTNKPSQTTQSTCNVKQLFGSKNIRNSSDTRGLQSNASFFFFSGNITTIIMKFTYIMRESFTKLALFFQSYLQPLEIQTHCPHHKRWATEGQECSLGWSTTGIYCQKH